MSTAIEGVRYLLGKDGQFEWVSRYTVAEMDELFTPHERMWLAEGKIVERHDGRTVTQWQDMVAITRQAREGA